MNLSYFKRFFTVALVCSTCTCLATEQYHRSRHRDFEPKFTYNKNKDLSEARDHEKNGQKEFKTGAYKTAADKFRTALQKYRLFWDEGHPILAVVYHNLGVALHMQGEYTEAIANYEKAQVLFEIGGLAMHSRSSRELCAENLQRAQLNNRVAYLIIDKVYPD